ncbi:MAG: hypothetical protein LBQ66_16955, partial [Planctomycetaceae bacterium]|nr:hypothetical protein [Planctomycetaceae bacterium]
MIFVLRLDCVGWIVFVVIFFYFFVLLDMVRNEYTSIFLPGSHVPEPPDWRPYVAMFFQVLMVLLFLGVIVFIFFETFMDAVDRPIWLGGVEAIKKQKELPTDAEVAAQFVLLTPLPQSKVDSEDVTIICAWRPDEVRLSQKGGDEPPYDLELILDGRPTAWTIRYGKTAWLLQTRLKPGVHTLKTEAFETEFVVEPMNKDIDIETTNRRSDRTQ